MYVTAEDAINGNTVLSAAERRMESTWRVWKGKTAATSTILEHLQMPYPTESHRSLEDCFPRIWINFQNFSQNPFWTLPRQTKVQIVKIAGKQGYLPKNIVEDKWDTSLLNMDYLTQEGTRPMTFWKILIISAVLDRISPEVRTAAEENPACPKHGGFPYVWKPATVCKISLQVRNKKMSEDFDSKRPDHPDFMDHSELRKRDFLV